MITYSDSNANDVKLGRDNHVTMIIIFHLGNEVTFVRNRRKKKNLVEHAPD